MNNFVAYFYNIIVDKIKFNDKYYYFYYHGYLYHLYPIYDDINVDFMVNINKRLLGYTLVSEIVINNDNNYVSHYNNQDYILIKIYVNINKKISLEELTYFDNLLYSDKGNTDWGVLWSKKIDYLEDLITENGKKYPLLVDSFNYFVGMAENAISYFNNININNHTYVVSHKVIKYDDTIECIYNPLNIIFDYSARDIAEYIKNSFFVNNTHIYDELIKYIKNNNVTIDSIMLIVARIMYPSFYFEMYEDILIYNKDERIIIPVIDKLNDYEKYLARMIAFFKKYYDIPEILWLKK